jgi:hypothetical protein
LRKFFLIEYLTAISFFFSPSQNISSLDGLQLTKLELLPINLNKWRDVIRFLPTQTRLKKLTLANVSWIPAGTELKPMKCAVRQLMLTEFVNDTSVESLEFLKLFGASVFDLTLVGIRGQTLSDQVLRTVLPNFTSLKNLVLRNFSLPNAEVYQQKLLKPSKSIVSLSLIAASLHNADEITGFFQLFPSVTDLHLSAVKTEVEINPVFFQSVTKRLENVRHLIVDGNVGIVDHSAFVNLQFITLRNFDAAEKVNWAELLKNNKKLTILHIEVSKNEDKLPFDILMESVSNPISLRLLGSFIFTEDRIKSFKAISTNKVLLKVKKANVMVEGEKYARLLGAQRFFIDQI